VIWLAIETYPSQAVWIFLSFLIHNLYDYKIAARGQYQNGC